MRLRSSKGLVPLQCQSPSLRQDGDPASLVVSVLSWIDLVVIFIGKFCLNHLARELILARTLC